MVCSGCSVSAIFAAGKQAHALSVLSASMAGPIKKRVLVNFSIMETEFVGCALTR
ncbi:hypothetical protein GPLA_0131 [Paraglaciecola polaris LMG 21857]|uniref:Uncharacterized protein n=1 Tax=Paraglaciecola polaris LMG 21857 TaxID=1129793 RepID=K6ZL50_9ALTE|nr:hypothetical protein GPLA_0131 [Paraglaciecola polaris LMG 21857]